MPQPTLRETGEKLSERQQTLFIAGFQWGPPPNFNPLSPTAAWPTAADQMQLIYETLFAFDILDGSLKPALAASMTSPDPMTMVVKLQPDAKWHDGKPVTADDVVYTFDLGKRVSTLYYSPAWEFLASVEKTDDKTVTFKLTPQGTVEQDFGVKPSAQEMRLLREAMLGRSAGLPEKPVAVGERWRNDDAIRALLDLTRDDTVSTVYSLQSIKSYEGRQVAEVRVSAAIMRSDKTGMSQEFAP